MIHVLRRLLYWCLPPVVFWIICTRIDTGRLQTLLAHADGWLVLCAAALLVPITVLGAWRWQSLSARYGGTRFSLGQAVAEYWKSLAVGLLLPGSIGSDAYRVLLAGRRSGLYLRAAYVIVVEKLAALAACMLLVAAAYPVLGVNHLPDTVNTVVHALYWGAVALGGLVILIALTGLGRWVARLAAALGSRIDAVAVRVAALASRRAGAAIEPPAGTEARRSALAPYVALPALGFSLAVFVLVAAQSQLLFLAFGHPVGFTANLFVTPLLTLLYALPISFGGLGLREGAFILAYGAFGVPMETALVISLCGLVGNLLTYAIGACLFATAAPQPAPARLHTQ